MKVPGSSSHMRRSLSASRKSVSTPKRLGVIHWNTAVTMSLWCSITCFLLWSAHAFLHTSLFAGNRPHGAHAWPQVADSPSGAGFNDIQQLQSAYTILRTSYYAAEPIEPDTLSAVLPVTHQSLPNLDNVLYSLLASKTQLHEIILLCPDSLLSEARKTSRRSLSSAGDHVHTELSLHSWRMDTTAVLHAASQTKTDWVLILDENGLENFGHLTREMLLSPLSFPLPVGPRGITCSPSNVSCAIATHVPQPAKYLVPPFVMPKSLVPATANLSKSAAVWSFLGEHVSDLRLDMIGGLISGFGDPDSEWCTTAQPSSRSEKQLSISHVDQQEQPVILDSITDGITHVKPLTGTFFFVFPSLKDINDFGEVVCRLQGVGHLLEILIYGSNDASADNSPPHLPYRSKLSRGCLIEYDTIAGNYEAFLDWLNPMDDPPDVILALAQDDPLTVALSSIDELDPLSDATLIRIPRSDLPHSYWMGSLQLKEWQNWHIPEVVPCVITNDRPTSLGRLLASLKNGYFFGDNLNLRINMEQTADEETLQIIHNFEWDQGAVFVHRRVIHGGLLPAVVESWYPHTNDSYGLLLEDDIEVSPYFYAWVKMCILRYRYGDEKNVSPQLFGISLYQQKNIELRPEGRQPFNARALLTGHNFWEPNTPYLSQIPCSWGAVYFPEHWREFHDYLAIRLSEHLFKIDQDIVPDIRSNKWTKSWKKYFIELVYLRGYAMLYPNYEGFVSLSTNHLEIGSHVKGQPRDLYLRKRELFLLPLMGLPADFSTNTHPKISLLDLPRRTLPAWNSLPVLDLLGFLSSMRNLVDQGTERRSELTECCKPASSPFDIRDLLCMTTV